MTSYPLAKVGVFRTIQGEGALLGLPMVFVRLGGCSVGCDHCDTDYRVATRATAAEIAAMASPHVWGGLRWAWLTGGEPLDHDITDLVAALHGLGLFVALATAGTRPARCGLSAILTIPRACSTWRRAEFLSRPCPIGILQVSLNSPMDGRRKAR